MSNEQREVLRSVRRRENVFVTGAAGTGKSTVLKLAIQLLRDRGLVVRVTAPTGIAALQIEGMRTWAFAGWTPQNMKDNIDELLKKTRDEGFYTRAGQRIRDTNVLVIDEISMVENNFHQRLSLVMARAKGNSLPFGVRPFKHCVVCGKEVRSGQARGTYRCYGHGEHEDKEKWAFHAPVWEDAQFTCIYLEENHRQSDPEFLDLLERFRLGRALTTSQQNKMTAGGQKLMNPVKRFALKDHAAKENARCLRGLPGESHKYECVDDFHHNPDHANLTYKGLNYTNGHKISLDAHRYEEHLELRVDAQVVLLANLDIDGGLVNGSQGRIVKFEPRDYASFPRANVHEEFTSWALDDTRERMAFRPASVLGGDYSSYKHEQQRGFINHQPPANVEWPVVKFNHGRTEAILPICSVEELGDEKPYSILSRTQVPLSLGYGLTIHKSQGMTLSAVEVDLSRAWEAGQAYVAVSRACSLEGLRVRGLNQGRSVVSMDRNMRDFYIEKFPQLRREFGEE